MRVGKALLHHRGYCSRVRHVGLVGATTEVTDEQCDWISISPSVLPVAP